MVGMWMLPVTAQLIILFFCLIAIGFTSGQLDAAPAGTVIPGPAVKNQN
jgi:hypothetical protein